jgi:adenosylhomocysteinase
MNHDLSIIKALKIGKVPMRGSRRMCVGRDPEIAEIEHILEYVAGGGFETRFLRGDYGSGKTFMCSVVRELAFGRGFAVSVVNLSREVPFGKRELVVAEIVRGLRSPTSGASSAFSEFVQRWLDKYDPATPYEENEALRAAMARVADVDSGMAMGLRAFHVAYIDGNEALMEGALAWLRGDTIEPEIRKAIKVVGKVTADGAFRRLRGIVALLKDAGAPGLVVLLDEAEAIYRLGNSPQRLAAYTAIRELIDTGEEEFPFSFFLFAGTPELFEDEFRGIASYAALYQRIRSQQVSNARDLRQPIIRLEELDRDGLTDVSRRVRDIHGAAYGYDSAARFTDADVDRFVVSAGEKFGNVRSKPRTYLKALVDALDARQQGLDANEVLEQAASIVEMADASLDDVVLAEF